MSPAAVVGQDHMRVGTQVIRLDMTMSLDGFVVGPQDSTEQPMGIGGFRLFNWLDSRLDPGPNGQVFAESSATRAVISGRRTHEHANRGNADDTDPAHRVLHLRYRTQRPSPTQDAGGDR